MELGQHFRWLMLGIAVGCVLVINAAVIILLRAAGMVVKPVDELVKTSRDLTERWGESEQAGRADEFSELSRGYDTLAAKLQEHEQRRMETIAQTALTLNHELNNAISTIGMQLQLLARKEQQDEKFEAGLKHIRESLHRMTQTVESLKHIKRIVLTDYISGVKMLDLQRSIEGAPKDEQSAADHPK